MTLSLGNGGRFLHGTTRSLCPECRQVVEGQVLVRDGAVYLRKHCPQHGWSEALVSSDVGWYLRAAGYDRPGQVPLDFAAEVDKGCPFDCGLCPEHRQHTCVGIIEITTGCNLACPTCFADSASGYQLTLAQVEAILDRFVETEGEPEVVQISGGEPTIHPEVLAIVAAAQARGIRHVMLNTNGIRLALDSQFVRQLARYHPTIYLQFDGVTASAHQALRGADLRAVKRQALDNLAGAGIHAVLVATIVRGVNDGEVGDILCYALKHPAVLGVCYQPVSSAGRSPGLPDPLRRSTVPGVLHDLERQTEGLFRVSDFRPVPCPHPACSACTYAYIDGGRVIPIPRLVNVDDYLELALNRTAVDLSPELAESLEQLWSMSAVIGTDRATDALACAGCEAEPAMLQQEALGERFFMVQVHAFMDEHNFDLRRVMKCCVHQLLPDGRAVPLCAYNNLPYRRQVRAELEQSLAR